VRRHLVRRIRIFIDFLPGNGSLMATNVVVLLLVVVLEVLVIRFSIAQGSVVSQPIVIKLHTY